MVKMSDSVNYLFNISIINVNIDKYNKGTIDKLKHPNHAIPPCMKFLYKLKINIDIKLYC